MAREKSARTARGLRSACVEGLEGRRLLSGNVVAAQVGTLLAIDGDNYGNQVKVWSPAPNVVKVQGEDYTRVNGTYDAWTFYNVQQIEARTNGGNDSFKAYYLRIAADSIGGMFVDGGAGDDCILMSNSTICATDGSNVELVGELLEPGQTSSGNDVIDVQYTTLFAEEGVGSTTASLLIAGEVNRGGTVTGGNDRITVRNTCLEAQGSDLAIGDAVIGIFGDQNDATDVTGSVIGQGNDCITVSGTTIRAAESELSNGALLRVVGDQNVNAGLAGNAFIGEGNDFISVNGADVASTGLALTSNATLFEIEGDNNFASASGLARIGGGNDDIFVDDVCVTASGGVVSNAATLNIFGDGNYDLLPQNFAVTSGGNDTICVTNTRVSATGLLGNAAVAQTYGDDFGSPTSIVGRGDDCITWRCVIVEGNPDATARINAGKGCDFVEVLNSRWGGGVFEMGSGNDVLKFFGNTFLTAILDGGPGYDKLYIGGNSGMVIINPLTFEEVHFS